MTKDGDIKKRFGSRIKNLRIQKGITSQMALGLKAKIDRTYTGGVERGERNVALKNIEKLAKALNIELSDLFKL